MRVGQDNYQRPQLSRCKRCNGFIHWVRMPSGAMGPVNAAPVEDGRYNLVQDRVPGTGLQQEWCAVPASSRLYEQRYQLHSSTCLRRGST